MRAAKLSVVLLLVALLSACGFKLRGSAELPGYKLPFATIALTLDPTSEFHAQLKRNIEASSPGTRVVADARYRLVDLDAGLRESPGQRRTDPSGGAEDDDATLLRSVLRFDHGGLSSRNPEEFVQPIRMEMRLPCS